MSTHNKTSETKKHLAKERRAGSRELIDKLVEERTEMLVLFCKLAGLAPFDDKKHHKPVRELLQDFCQVLVDYIAAGHFSLYDRIVNSTERRREISELAEQLYPRIARSTQAALDFNDRYDCGDHCQIADNFHDELSRMGEEIASRIEIEDKLIAAVMR